MPKPNLFKEDAILESQIIDTLEAGLKRWRPDLSYPESYSDMQACVRGLLMVFDVKRLPLPKPLRIECHVCDGLGYMITKAENSYRESTSCKECKGRGHIPSE
jgi:hypothetical protein